MSERTALDDLLHRVNNLLATIAMQCEVARTAGTLQASQEALRMIRESAERTRDDVERFRRERPRPGQPG